MLYALYKPNGEIWQANKVYDQPEYGNLLRERELPFVAMNHPGLISFDTHYVNTNKRWHRFKERPRMPISVDKTWVKCDGKEQAVFRNIRPNARCIVYAAGEVLENYPMLDATELGIVIPMPCTYRVRFELFPFRPFVQDIEGVAP